MVGEAQVRYAKRRRHLSLIITRVRRGQESHCSQIRPYLHTEVDVHDLSRDRAHAWSDTLFHKRVLLWWSDVLFNCCDGRLKMSSVAAIDAHRVLVVIPARYEPSPRLSEQPHDVPLAHGAVVERQWYLTRSSRSNQVMIVLKLRWDRDEITLRSRCVHDKIATRPR
jgi:hypothetical protein